jgi:hypothetical protein
MRSEDGKPVRNADSRPSSTNDGYISSGGEIDGGAVVLVLGVVDVVVAIVPAGN